MSLTPHKDLINFSTSPEELEEGEISDSNINKQEILKLIV
jgi:hypothetical protein